MSIKETTDVLGVAKVISLEITKAVIKDGFQLEDVGAFLKSPDFDKALADAISGIEKVPGEVVGLSNPFNIFDDVALAKFCYSWATEIAAAVRAQHQAPAA